MMESTAELNETAMESSADDAVVHVKRKETESSAAEAPELVDQPSSSALKHPSSPETLVEALGGNDIELDPGLGSEPAVAVEELTVDNYKGPSLFRGGGSSSGGEGSMAKKGLWSNLTRLSGPPELPNYSKFSDYLAESENRLDGRPVEGIWTKVLPASGFPQFVVRSNLQGHGVKHELRGKGLVNRHQVSFKEPHTVRKNQNNAIKQLDNVGVDYSLLGGPNKRVGGEVLGGAGNCVVSNIRSDGISLREWLTPRSHKLHKSERLHLFKQVLEIVDSSHMQGLVLQNLRPSCFSIMPSNLVKYVGSFIPQMEQSVCSVDQDIGYLEHHSKRRRYFEYGNEEQGKLSPKYQRHDISHTSARMQGYPTVFGAGWRHSISELQKLEEIWYASPEELQENICSSSSNIYSLGVLFFELFCCFETWEVHSAAMSDLRHRILPPSFLSESPKEASFCLWLLHPEPSSRPHSREILQSDLICKDRNFTSLDQLLASIEEEDAEADLLLHFLLNLKEQKEKQAAKLGANVECLKADIEEVERRYSSRSEFLSDACGPQTNFKDISDSYPLKRPINMEGASRFSDSNVNDERFMKNIDQLENVYFSLRSKVEEVKLPEMSTVARFDTDVLEFRDKYSQAQNGDNTWTKSTDPLGTFFEGLCKYARYSKFEVCGSLRSVDIVNSANVICSLSFDRDEDYVAAAGVSKKIKIFEFDALLKDSVDVHYPLTEMSNRSKLSCVCWNNYIKNYLASTDYEGVVQLWDASTGQGFTQYAEHQKRAWSVDFSFVDPTKLASGSDDCSVKLWSINEAQKMH
ncbi:protein SPA1-RELATED 2-like [Iris pallida]|uniref:Protein SPA1-RELATED 2-like n=1 Tax=Iris pallida TaxID=29817 RepID=A0AAX6GLA2_IRIPA|nr:protein SPA1-RELATED 2-like [Iris pallida]